MPHRLDPLLRPRSIAVIGASESENTVGRTVIENLLRGRYPGTLYAVNPRYASVVGVPCYPSLSELPDTVEHVIFAVADRRVEGVLDEVIAHGARAATIMSSLVLADDGETTLRERVAAKLRQAGMLVCGGNGMGFYNFRDRVWACGFETREHRSGNVALISHSGSGMCGIVDVDARLDFSLVVSTGQELTVSMDEYLDFVLDLAETRVVGLFMETVRNPPGMIRALQKARDLEVPIVAIKVGRTELAARLTVSHSGAIAGVDSAYQALFERYGVQRVDDMDQLATALIMFAQPHSVAAGDLVSLHDSGGERQLLIDMADQAQVSLAPLSGATVERLEGLLDPGLPAVNPLDAWSAGGPNFHQVMEDSFAVLMADPNAALGAVVHDRSPDGGIYPSYVKYLRRGHAASGKPVFLVANRQGTGADPQVVEVTRQGFPVLDGLGAFLRGVRCLLDYRDFRARAGQSPANPDPGFAGEWRDRLASCETLGEGEALDLLEAGGLPTNPHRIVDSEEALLAAAEELGFPVALKTAASGIFHKSDVGGVKLDLGDREELTVAYRDISARLGPRALVAPMVVHAGVEMLLGLQHDEQFGPIVVLGFGGAQAEVLRDVVHLLPPFDAATAARGLRSLRLRRLLEQPRGGHELAVESFCEVAAAFSVVAASLAGIVQELDVNPVVVHAEGSVAVDALVIGRALH
jgi:acyl-CoA synthetase (NDP forming)